LRAFAEANGREHSGAEERLLRGIAEEIGPNGWLWIRGAIDEAVDSGSGFVAPKRVREICRRWLAEGLPPEVAGMRVEEGGQRGAELAPADEAGESERANAGGPSGGEDMASDENLLPSATSLLPIERGPFRVEEAGLGSGQVWAAVRDVLLGEGMMRPSDVRDYLSSAELVARLDARTFVIEVGDALSRSRIEQFWTAEIEEAFGMVLGGRGWRVEIRERGDVGLGTRNAG
jgi:hypothetical protein